LSRGNDLVRFSFCLHDLVLSCQSVLDRLDDAVNCVIDVLVDPQGASEGDAVEIDADWSQFCLEVMLNVVCLP
jgi:hypothetical protein